jgi:hypothetical protein
VAHYPDGDPDGPAGLAAVASGEMGWNELQPYATMDVDAHLSGIESGWQDFHLDAASFDRE